MNDHSFTREGYDRGNACRDGNTFLIANGYLGMRGTVEEADSSLLPAVTLSGLYDRRGDLWREPVNAPIGLYAKLSFNGKTLAVTDRSPISHSLSIDYNTGIFSRKTDFGEAEFLSERFASLKAPHLLSEKITLRFKEKGEAVLTTGISADIWDLNGPHLFDYKYTTGEILTCEAVTGEQHVKVAVSQCMDHGDGACGPFRETGVDHGDGVRGSFRDSRFPVEEGDTIEISVFSAVYTGLDEGEPVENAVRLAAEAKAAGYEKCKDEHIKAWDDVWKRCEVKIKGNPEASLYFKASQFYLNSIAPRHADALSIPARGLSGQTYKGAVFWDSEIFLFPEFVYTQPEIAKSLLKYRIETLPGARKKAAEYGFRGAYYAWESQEGGTEGCTDFNVVDAFTHRPVRTYFRDKQIHISADICYALWEYYRITGDRSLLKEGGAEVILECSRFYISRANAHIDSECVDFADVIGPDEYHERVTNNAFTNRMIRYCFENALKLREVFRDESEWFGDLLDRLDYSGDLKRLSDICQRIGEPYTRNNVIEQFDGYFKLEDCSLKTVRERLADPKEYWGGDHGVAGTTQIIKQADVIAMLALFPENFSKEEVKANYDYYEPRTEHGSSLSACMYALTACRIGCPGLSWDHFIKSASIDIIGGGKQWAGDIYIGGTHPAANGGAWMIAVLGFAGLTVRDGKLQLDPHLPDEISELEFPIEFRGKRYRITVNHEGWKTEEL